MDKKIELKREYRHYVLYVNGKFYGSYDTVTEAAKDIDSLRNESVA